MHPALLKLYKTVYDSVHTGQEHLATFQAEALSAVPSRQELADAIFALRSSCKLFEEIEKTLNKVEELLIKLLSHSVNEDERTTCTPWTCVTINNQYYYPVPKRGDPTYVALCEYLGVPEDLPMDFSWNALAARIEQDLSQAKNPPIDLSKQILKYSVTCRERKNLITHQDIKEEK